MRDTLKIFFDKNPNFVSMIMGISTILNKLVSRWVLIGAWARYLNLNHQLPSIERITQDYDFLIVIKDWDNFERIKKAMGDSGFVQALRLPYRFIKRPIIVDLLPFSREIVKNNKLKWEGYDIELDFSGSEDALSQTKTIHLQENVSFEILSVPGLVLLKILSYLDRPDDRAHDLEDVFFCFKHYEDGVKRFDVCGMNIDGENILYEHSGAYLIGVEAGRFTKDIEARQKVSAFCDTFLVQDSEIVARAADLARSFLVVEDRRCEVVLLIRRFRSGFLGKK